MGIHHVSIRFATTEGNGPPLDLPRPCPVCLDEGWVVVREASRHDPIEFDLCRCPAGTAFLRAHHAHSDATITIRESILDDLSQVPF